MERKKGWGSTGIKGSRDQGIKKGRGDPEGSGQAPGRRDEEMSWRRHDLRRREPIRAATVREWSRWSQ